MKKPKKIEEAERERVKKVLKECIDNLITIGNALNKDMTALKEFKKIIPNLFKEL